MIKSHFSQFGEIIDCVVPRDPRTRFAKGFAFVTYTKGKAVDEVMSNRPHQVGVSHLRHLTIIISPRWPDAYSSRNGPFHAQNREIQPRPCQRPNCTLVKLAIWMMSIWENTFKILAMSPRLTRKPIKARRLLRLEIMIRSIDASQRNIRLVTKLLT